MQKFNLWFEANRQSIGLTLAALTALSGLVDLAVGHSVLAMVWLALAAAIVWHATSD